VLENVRGHLSLGFDVVLADLADLGWSAQWGVVRASDAGACHQRARLFIVAHPGSRQQPWASTDRHGLSVASQCSYWPSDAHVAGLEGPQSARGRFMPDGSPTADADLAGGQARGNTRHNSQRIWQQPVGLAAPIADTECSGRQEEQSQSSAGRGESDATGGGVDWGDYGPAIARWERVIGRPAPAPTEPGRTGAPRLAPRFVEWMMGLPDGHVTDPAIGISRNDQLKALGNGVVPQQAALALDVLLQGTPYDIRQGLATV
jgi:DNA (cytosine-5)-methyltransferase 1